MSLPDLLFFIIACIVGFVYRELKKNEAKRTIVSIWKIASSQAIKAEEIIKCITKIKVAFEKLKISGYANPFAYIIPWFRFESENLSLIYQRISELSIAPKENQFTLGRIQNLLRETEIDVLISSYFNNRIPVEKVITATCCLTILLGIFELIKAIKIM